MKHSSSRSCGRNGRGSGRLFAGEPGLSAFEQRRVIEELM